ncbi:MAG: sucrase ferredoxin, partial [Lapillicoccus sp.]
MTTLGPAHVTHGRSAPDACSVLWDRASTDESAYGTSAPARFWVAVEQNGPWGRTPALQSSFPPAIGAELLGRFGRAGGRLALIRRPGTHADPRTGPRRCYVAWSGPGAFVLEGRLDDPDGLLRLDLEALGRGDRAGTVASLPWLAPSDPILLVCTNGRHDVCCAVRGRPVALAGQETHPGRVWECSHTGG